MSFMRLQPVHQSDSSKNGFALPTVLIASVVMLIVLLAALQTVSAYTAGLQEQYYQKIADEAAESGINYARACLDANPDATWAELRTDTNCNGAVASGVNCASTPTNSRCGVINTSLIRSTFSIATPTRTGKTVALKAEATASLMRGNSGGLYRSVDTTRSLEITQTSDPIADRATQRYWYVGQNGSTKFDFGASGTSDPTLTQYPSGPGFVEGLTVITDTNGKLLFTTNGITATDANNKTMPGSSGGLGATGSTAQGVVAFPISGNRYVVVGNSAGADGNNPANPGDYGILKKSIISMDQTGSNGSVGDVEAGSIQSITRSNLNAVSGTLVAAEPNGTENYTGQYMTAAPEAFGNGYWLVFGTPGRPYFYAILFNNNGNITKVVRSSTPDNGPIPVCKWAGNNAWRAAFGIAHFNTAYNKIVIKNGTAGCDSTDSTRRSPVDYDPAKRDVGWIYLRSFDNATGLMGNVYSQLANQQWYAGTSCIDSTRGNSGYSVDFSPDENYVYETSIYPGRIYRFRITGSDIASGTNIATTEQFVGKSDLYPSGSTDGGQVRRAPNGKMYVAQRPSTSIHTIEFPESSAASAYSNVCTTNATNFKYNNLSLGGSVQSGLGLPDYVTRYVPRQILY